MAASEASKERARPIRPLWADVAGYAAQLGVVGVAYVAGAKAGLHLALVDRQVTPLWPPTGIALVALLVLGPRMWPAITAGAFIVNLPLGPSTIGAAGIAAGNTLAPLAAYALLRTAGFRPQLNRLRDAVGLVFLGGCGMLVSATLGSLVLLASDRIAARDFATTWWVWWTGDAMGVLVFAPFFLSLFHLRDRKILRFARVFEGLALLVACGLVIHATLAGSFHALYLVFPFIVWAAYRFHVVGAAAVALVISIIATLAVAHGWSPYAGQTLLRKMAALHAFNATVSLTAFFLAAVASERADAGAALQLAGAELESRVRERTAELSAANQQLEQEIDERARIEAALQESRATLEEAQRLSHVGSWSWDMRTGIVDWSDEMFRIYGYEPRAFPVTFEKAMERVVPEDEPRILANLQARIEAGAEAATPPIEYRIRLPDGRERILIGHGRIAFEDGAPARMVGTVQDVTPAKEAESAMRQAFEREREAAAQLRAADELKDEFLSNVSHELRTPLTPILGFSDLLLRHPDAEDGSHDDMIGRIHTNALSMQDLIGRLLDDSRLQAGRVELHLRPLGLRAEVERCLDQLGPLVGRDRVVVRVDGDARVLADPHALERILVNVVGNAAKFSPDRGTILIEARDAGSDVEVSVRDEGPGVAAGDEERIFERFFQGVRTRRGTGIGLSVARRYVEMLGGRIWAENRPQGGAAFSFTLPRAEGARNAPPG